MKEYNKENIPFAKELRRNMTKEERKLWYDFLRTYSTPFQRQKSIGNYIVDFYCAKIKLVIELDGSGHYTKEQEEYDKKRTEELESKGFRVVRFTNLEINNNFNGICQYIEKLVNGEFI